MTRIDLTDITVVVDRSGSMASVRSESENSFNKFLDDQRKLTDECRITLVKFDNEYEMVYQAIPIQEAPRFTMEPRGWTALYDAVGKSIVSTGSRLASMKEKDRPGKVLFVIITDGEENASKEYTGPQVKKMIQHQEDTYSWHFTYLGAGIDDVQKVAADLGLKAGKFAKAARGASGQSAGYQHVNCSVAAVRGAVTQQDFAVAANNFYPEEEVK